jgi:hypothetical protein
VQGCRLRKRVSRTLIFAKYLAFSTQCITASELRDGISRQLSGTHRHCHEISRLVSGKTPGAYTDL